jgi:bifunctional UDP-N-acetylglucosamine pyrophosphorylase/glucosamine-1-phosphate N-acetyltransferase
MPQGSDEITSHLGGLSDTIGADAARVAIILAAGHGKRIRSETSKMLFPIWGKPTVSRVAEAAAEGLDSDCQVIVVGIKGLEVSVAVGSRPGRVFAYQENLVQGNPAGTGDAVRVGLACFDRPASDRDVYVLLGDMGLASATGLAAFRSEFERSRCHMMILTGHYTGPIEENGYGRIVRVPEADADGAASGETTGNVIAIVEHKDALGLDPDGGGAEFKYHGRRYLFSRDELLNSREVNTGVVAYREAELRAHITALSTDNIQGEFLLTDLVEVFNRQGLIAKALLAGSEDEILAFNTRKVWRQMESIARRRVYERIWDIVTVMDGDDFYVADEVIDRIIELDASEGPLDISVGKGAWIGPEVQLGARVRVGDRCRLEGSVVLEEGVTLGPDVVVSGSPEYPAHIGRDARVTDSWLVGCRVETGVTIAHSTIERRLVRQRTGLDGASVPIRHIRPTAEGLEAVGDLPES